MSEANSAPPKRIRLRHWIGITLILISVVIEMVAKLMESSWYPDPLRSIQIGLFLCGVLVAATGPPQWWLRHVERRVQQACDDYAAK